MIKLFLLLLIVLFTSQTVNVHAHAAADPAANDADQLNRTLHIVGASATEGIKFNRTKYSQNQNNQNLEANPQKQQASQTSGPAIKLPQEFPSVSPSISPSPAISPAASPQQK